MTRVLLIDDSSFMRKILREALEKGGFEVDEFLPQSALEVMERIKASKPDLVLSDYNMPLVNGLEVAKMARRAAPLILVVILTASHDPATEALLKTTGVRRILHKPITGEEVVMALKELLSH